MSNEDLLDQLSSSCVLFLDDRGLPSSGFIIAPGFAATAAHCVRTRKKGEVFTAEIAAGSSPKRCVQASVYDLDPSADVAIVQLGGCDDIASLPIGENVSNGQAWLGYGFPRVVKSQEQYQGIPLAGLVRYGRWRRNERTLVLLESREGLTRATLEGCSGSAVAVDGAIVAILVEQFRDPIKPDESTLGLLKAVPIREAFKLLPADVQAAKRPKPKRAEPVECEVEVADMFSWCDRENVVDKLKNWLRASPQKNKGLFCLVGHVENQKDKLLRRVAQELGEQSDLPLSVSHVPILSDIDPGDDEMFCSKICNSLSIPTDREIEQSVKLKSRTGLILLSISCDLPSRDKGEIESRIMQAARWLESIELASSRVVVVLDVDYHRLGPADRLLHRFGFRKPIDRVANSVNAAKMKYARLDGLLVGTPTDLLAYERLHLSRWAGLPLVRDYYGHRLNGLNDVAADWFEAKEQIGHKELLGRIRQYFEEKNITQEA